MAMDNQSRSITLSGQATTGLSILDLAQNNGYFTVRALKERLELIEDAILAGRAKPTDGLLEEMADLMIGLDGLA